MKRGSIQNATEMVDLVQQVGFLPLLYSGISGFSAEEVVDNDCRYVVYSDGGWDWPMWKWKGPIVTEGNCVYGKFFDKKAGYISMDWWPDFMNWRRHACPAPPEGSIEEAIVLTLREHGSLITRELRAACGFTGTKMRSRFDGYITRLQMACRIVTQDFVYPRDKHGKEYGWGWAPEGNPAPRQRTGNHETHQIKPYHYEKNSYSTCHAHGLHGGACPEDQLHRDHPLMELCL